MKLQCKRARHSHDNTLQYDRKSKRKCIFIVATKSQVQKLERTCTLEPTANLSPIMSSKEYKDVDKLEGLSDESPQMAHAPLSELEAPERHVYNRTTKM